MMNVGYYFIQIVEAYDRGLQWIISVNRARNRRVEGLPLDVARQANAGDRSAAQGFHLASPSVGYWRVSGCEGHE